MILEDMIRKCILDALKKVKDADPACQDWVLNESTIVLGEGSAMDSIAFTFFVTECEETIETETHHPFTFNLEDFHDNQDVGTIKLSVDQMAKTIAGKLASKEATGQSN